MHSPLAGVLLIFWALGLLGIARLFLHTAGIWPSKRLLQFTDAHPLLAMIFPVLNNLGGPPIDGLEGRFSPFARAVLRPIVGSAAVALTGLAAYLIWLGIGAMGG